MRKLFALAMVAVLSLTIALAVLGCGKKEDESSSTPPAEQSTMPADSGAAMSDSGMTHMGSDSTGMK